MTADSAKVVTRGQSKDESSKGEGRGALRGMDSKGRGKAEADQHGG